MTAARAARSRAMRVRPDNRFRFAAALAALAAFAAGSFVLGWVAYG